MRKALNWALYHVRVHTKSELYEYIPIHTAIVWNYTLQQQFLRIRGNPWDKDTVYYGVFWNNILSGNCNVVCLGHVTCIDQPGSWAPFR